MQWDCAVRLTEIRFLTKERWSNKSLRNMLQAKQIACHSVKRIIPPKTPKTYQQTSLSNQTTKQRKGQIEIETTVKKSRQSLFQARIFKKRTK